MEFCDVTGDTDFDFFNPCFGRCSNISIPDPAHDARSFLNAASSLNFYNDENDRLLFDIQLRKLRPLFEESIDGDRYGRDDAHTRSAAAEPSISQEFPPNYPKLHVPDPFIFLKSRNQTGVTRKTRDGRTTEVFPLDDYGTEKPYESCNHDEPAGNKRFIIHFDRSSVASDRSDQCYAAERDRCIQFWEFVKETPDLLKVIKEGKFVHSGPPSSVHCVLPEEQKFLNEMEAATGKKGKSKKLVGSATPKGSSKYTPEMLALKRRNEQIHKDISGMRQRLHERFMRTQPKSSHPSAINLTPAKQLSVTTICGHYADCATRKVDEVLEEMEEFDGISSNPVRIACDRRKQSGPCPQELDKVPPLLDQRYGEYEGEVDYDYSSYFFDQDEDSDDDDEKAILEKRSSSSPQSSGLLTNSNSTN